MEKPLKARAANSHGVPAAAANATVLTMPKPIAGRIVLLADETLGLGDARVEWADGGAERDTGRLMRDIDGALARALDTIPVLGTSPLEENNA